MNQTWPAVLQDNQSIEGLLEVYRKELEDMCGSTYLPVFTATQKALRIFTLFQSDLLLEKRWKNYQVDDTGDMNLATHTLRETLIIIRGLFVDRIKFGFNEDDVDVMVAASLLQDLGVLIMSDITYDERVGNKDVEIDDAKALLAMLDGVVDMSEADKIEMKRDYLLVTTSLSVENMQLLGIDPSAVKIKWTELRNLFVTYKKYSYLITAFQVAHSVDSSFSESEKEMLISWDRQDLEDAFSHGTPIDPNVRKLILFKNVILNQWPYILEKSEAGLSSVKKFFENDLVVQILQQTNTLLYLHNQSLC